MTRQNDQQVAKRLLDQVVEWSSKRPLWQQDALRRLVQRGSLTDNDLNELTQICKNQYIPPAGDDPGVKAIPLTDLGLGEADASSAPVTLVSISDTRGVNAFPDSASLSFVGTEDQNQSVAGLVIVYGENASGKSGFARILRSACRSRSRERDVLRNMLSDGVEDSEQAALITYRYGDKLIPFKWTTDGAQDRHLKSVSVFDADYAEAQLSGPNRVSFLPSEIELLKRLAEGACQSVSNRLNDEIDALERRRTLDNPEISSTTEAGRMLRALSHESKFGEFKAIGRLSTVEKNRQSELRLQLARNPGVAATRLKARGARLENFSEELRGLEESLSEEGLRKLQSVRQRALGARQAARFFAEESFGDDPLGDIGTGVWRRLWEAAREYSRTAAYPARDFPVTGEGARCVLCQQQLSEEASLRLRRFDEFIKDKTASDAEVAEKDFDAMLLRLPQPGQAARYYESFLRELRLADPAVAAVARRMLKHAREMRRTLTRRHSRPSVSWDRLKLAVKASTAVAGVASVEIARADELSELATSPGRRQLYQELKELDDRERLGELLSRIKEEIHILQSIEGLKKCESDTDTAAISREVTRMAEQVVSSGMKERFEQELKDLGFRTATVTLENPGSEYGSPRFQIQLSTKSKIRLKRVLSEGEFRCVAIAGFLAELAPEQDSSSIVFDDPVTSLDHNWRDEIACRLVREAAGRQVVIFTHDVVFLMQLLGHAKKQRVAVCSSHLERVGNVFPSSRSGRPWVAMGVKQRIGILKNDHLLPAKRLYEAKKLDEYGVAVRNLYARLRETWERAVEEVLLNRVVTRFGREIHISQMGKLDAIEAQDVETIDRGFSRCSLFLHDSAPAENRSRKPDPDVIADDIGAVEEWVKSARNRLTT